MNRVEAILHDIQGCLLELEELYRELEAENASLLETNSRLWSERDLKREGKK